MTDQERPQPEIRPHIIETIDFADKILRGEYGDDFPDAQSLDPAEVFSGPILDLNDASLTDQEKAFIAAWIKRQLGSNIEDAPLKAKFQSPDNRTTVDIYNVRLGSEEDPWYVSQWQNEGEEPSYIFWAEEVYQWQVEAGYTEIKRQE